MRPLQTSATTVQAVTFLDFPPEDPPLYASVQLASSAKCRRAPLHSSGMSKGKRSLPDLFFLLTLTGECNRPLSEAPMALHELTSPRTILLVCPTRWRGLPSPALRPFLHSFQGWPSQACPFPSCLFLFLFLSSCPFLSSTFLFPFLFLWASLDCWPCLSPPPSSCLQLSPLTSLLSGCRTFSRTSSSALYQNPSSAGEFEIATFLPLLTSRWSWPLPGWYLRKKLSL